MKQSKAKNYTVDREGNPVYQVRLRRDFVDAIKAHAARRGIRQRDIVEEALHIYFALPRPNGGDITIAWPATQPMVAL